MELKKRLLDQIQIYSDLVQNGMASRTVEKTRIELEQEDIQNREAYIEKHKNRMITPAITPEIEAEAKAVRDKCLTMKKDRKRYIPFEWIVGAIFVATVLANVWFLMAGLWLLLLAGIGIGIGVYFGKFGYIENVLERKDFLECDHQYYAVISQYEKENKVNVSTDTLAKEYSSRPVEIQPYKTVYTRYPNRIPTPHTRFFVRWWLTEMRNLVIFLDKLEDGTQDFDTSVNVGLFEPNFSDTQKAILYQIHSTTPEKLLRIIAGYIQLKNDKKLLGHDTKVESIKNKIVQRFMPSTLELDSTQAQDSEAFFLPRFSALVPFKARQRHSYIVGASGSGKSELIKLFLYNDIKHGSGCLLIDPHNELSLEVSAYDIFRKHPERLVFIHPKSKEVLRRLGIKNMNKGYTPQFNPLEYRYHHLNDKTPEGYDDKMELVKARAAGLRDALEIATKVKFTPQMRNLVFNGLVVLLWYEGMRLRDLVHFMDDERNQKYIEMARKIKRADFICDFYRDNGDFFGKNYDTSKDGIRSRLGGFLSEGNIARIIDCEHSSFSITKLLQAGKTVIINLHPILSEEGAKALGAMLVSDITMWGYSRNTENARSVFVYIDEVQNFITPTIIKALGQIRKFGIHFTLANQGLSQFDTDDAATKKTVVKGAVLTNTRVKFIGLTGTPSEATELTKATGGTIDINKAELGTGRWVMHIPPNKAQIIDIILN